MPKRKSPSDIPLSVPCMSGNELKYLKECITSNWVSYVGPFVSRFEEKMASYIGTPHAVATNSGTAALHTALLVAGITPGDEVLVPDLTFIAPINAVHYCGGFPVFMDVEPIHGQLDAEKMADFLKTQCEIQKGKAINKKTGRPIKAVIPVHLLGHPCDMNRILEVARQYGLLVIEDCAQSLGTQYKGQRVGSFGDIGCFSYNGNKIITCGGGGMITTRNAEWAERAKYLTTQARDNDQDFVHHSVGYNYRLTNIQAAVGLAQMEQLDSFIAIKRKIARRYEQGLQSIPGLELPHASPAAFSTYWLYTVRIDASQFGMSRRELQKKLAEVSIQTRPLWAPLHEQRPYVHCQHFKIEVTPKMFESALSLPCSIGLTAKDQTRVIRAIQKLSSQNKTMAAHVHG